MSKRTSLLIVDDELPQQTVLKLCFEKRGFDVHTASSAEEALRAAQRSAPAVVITDLRLGGMNGLELLSQLKASMPLTEVILITAYGDVETAVGALKAGAADFILKPVELDHLVRVVQNALDRQRILAPPAPATPAPPLPASCPIVTAHPLMLALLERAQRAAASDATILIRGESGTGKELLARFIQQHSSRAALPFVAVNCAALHENLLESELFGHCKGAFTGAIQERIGRFEEANGGTIFLDEIGDLPLGTQVKLLRVLQEGELQRVGENKTISVNVRVLAATNQHLERMLAARTFRQDLYYRFNVISFCLPPLRERPEDIPVLAEHFLKAYASRMGRSAPALSPRARQTLLNYDFPGNVRELENMMHRTLVMTPGDTIDQPFIHADVSGLQPLAHASSASDDARTLDELLAHVERDAIERALQATNFNQAAAAQRLGITERQLRYRKKQLGIR